MNFSLFWYEELVLEVCLGIFRYSL